MADRSHLNRKAKEKTDLPAQASTGARRSTTRVTKPATKNKANGAKKAAKPAPKKSEATTTKRKATRPSKRGREESPGDEADDDPPYEEPAPKKRKVAKSVPRKPKATATKSKATRASKRLRGEAPPQDDADDEEPDEEPAPKKRKVGGRKTKAATAPPSQVAEAGNGAIDEGDEEPGEGIGAGPVAGAGEGAVDEGEEEPGADVGPRDADATVDGATGAGDGVVDEVDESGEGVVAGVTDASGDGASGADATGPREETSADGVIDNQTPGDEDVGQAVPSGTVTEGQADQAADQATGQATDQATGIDTGTTVPGDDAVLVTEEREKWRELEVLEESQADQACKYEDNDAKLIVTLKVHTDSEGLRSRLGYYARFILRHTGGVDAREGDMDNDVIGSIQSWRITKCTHRVPDAENVTWREELLSSASRTKEQALRKETAECLQVIFNRDGTLRKEAKARADALDGESLIFIEMIHIRQAFARQKLLRPALEAWYAALQRLPEWYAFSGTLILVPSPPAGPRGDVWSDKPDEEVERILIGTYHNHGFEVWVEAGVGGEAFTVMGRKIPDAPAGGNAGPA